MTLKTSTEKISCQHCVMMVINNIPVHEKGCISDHIESAAIACEEFSENELEDYALRVPHVISPPEYPA